jgi:hypothetical protein
MSAFPRIATKLRTSLVVRFVPKADKKPTFLALPGHRVTMGNISQSDSVNHPSVVRYFVNLWHMAKFGQLDYA